MSFDTIKSRLETLAPGAVVGANSTNLDPWIEIEPQHLVAACRALRDDADLRFDFLNCITGVDYLEIDPKKAAKADFQPHIELLYHLTSLATRERVCLKVRLPRWADAAGTELPQAPSVAEIWRTADWHEREVFDLVGVDFTGHPDPRRILCPEDWEGHPLRKDYEQPLEYHGIRGR